MGKITVQHTYLSIVFGISCVASALLLGCAPTHEPPALEEARTAYRQAQSEPQIPAKAPIALHEAEQTLHQAEQVWQDKQDEAETQHLAYLTEQKVARARAIAQQKTAEGHIQELSAERDKLLREAPAREAQQMRQEAVRAQQEALQAQQEAAQVRQEAQTAQAQSAILAQELSSLQAKVNDTNQGLVLTLNDVLFAPNTATIEPGAKQNLYPLITFLREHPTRQVSIAGYTDNTGNSSYNLDLSQRRAEAVRGFLIHNGIQPTRITAHGFGEADPVAPNDTAAGRQQNRRVEITVMQ
jgi:outer membrane protein OmpA-like peptidoglycan-associated protein